MDSTKILNSHNRTAVASGILLIKSKSLKTLVDKWVKTSAVVEPNPENVRYYQDRFNAMYTKLYPTLRSLKL